MRIMTGKETENGEFRLRCIGESEPGETPKEALTRVASSFLKKPLQETKNTFHESWDGPGIPAVMVEKKSTNRLFCIDTAWNAETKQYEIA